MSSEIHTSIEKRQDALENDQSNMSGILSEQGHVLASLTTSVESIAKQLSVLFHRGDRPTPWGVILSGVGILILLVGAIITPIMSDIHELKMHEIDMISYMSKNEYRAGVTDTDIKWLKDMSDRNYQLSHRKASE